MDATNAVMEQALPSAGQHFFTFNGTEIVGNAFSGIAHALFASGSEAQVWQHQCLLTGNGRGIKNLSCDRA